MDNFAQRFEWLSIKVTNIETKLTQLKQEVPKLKKSLKETLVRVLTIILLYELNIILLALVFVYQAKPFIVIVQMLCLFMAMLALSLVHGYWVLGMRKREVKRFLRNVRELKREVCRVCYGYATYVKACDEIEDGGVEVLRLVGLYRKVLWVIGLGSVLFHVAASVLFYRGISFSALISN